MGKIKRADLDLIRCFAIIFVISVHGLSYVVDTYSPVACKGRRT